MWVPRKETVGNLWFPVGRQDRETAEPPRTDRKTLPPSADTETDPLLRLLCDPRWEKSILRSCWSSPLIPGLSHLWDPHTGSGYSSASWSVSSRRPRRFELPLARSRGVGCLRSTQISVAVTHVSMVTLTRAHVRAHACLKSSHSPTSSF